MKLSFTTLGCPDWSLETIIAGAGDYGFDAIDFRGLSGEMNIYKLPEFGANATETRRRIHAAGLTVSCFSSSVKLVSRAQYEQNLQEITEYARLCEEFETPYIRVFGGSIGDLERSEAVEIAAAHLQEMARIAKAHGAKVLIETHDDWTSCEHVRALMERVDSDAVGVLWDVHHPYRMLGEQFETTWNALGRWIEYTHFKDSRLTGSGGDPEFQYCLAGEGNIPIPDAFALLSSHGYQGFYTLEWEKKWHPEIENAEVAFPHYVQYMRKLED
ncbi:MAG: Xylose isomerase [Bacilli bacterium]|nr:Xylose isomerase [Bacilli bacterium]